MRFWEHACGRTVAVIGIAILGGIIPALLFAWIAYGRKAKSKEQPREM